LICSPDETKLQSENLGSLKKNPNPISRHKNIRSPKKRGGKREKHSKIKIARKRREKKTQTLRKGKERNDRE